MLIRAARRPALPERTAFSTLAGALQRLDLLQMKATIGRRAKPTLPIHPPPIARAQPSFGETRARAVPYPAAITQMLPSPAIRRAPTSAMPNFSRKRAHSFLVGFVTTREPPLGLRHDNHARSHRQYDFASSGISLDAIFNCEANRVQPFGALAREKPSGANPCIAFCLEKIGRARKTPLDGARVIVHRIAIEACLFQNFLALVSIAVQIMWRAFGQSHIHIRVRFNRVIDDFGPRVLLWPSPNGETKPPARFQNTARFRASLFRT